MTEFSTSSRKVAGLDRRRVLRLTSILGILPAIIFCGGTDAAGPAATTLTIDPSGATLVVGQAATFTARRVNHDGVSQVDSTVTWTSSAPAILTISAAGRAQASSPGRATVTATSGSVPASVEVTVVPVPVHAIQMSAGSLTLELDRAVRLTAVPLAASGQGLPGRIVNWRSESASVATVDENGLVRSVAEGVTEIIATSEGKAGRTIVIVVPRAVAELQVTPDFSVLEVGRSRKLTAVTRDSGGAVLSGRAVTWESLTPAVVSVTAAGEVTALAPGRGGVRATVEGRTAQAEVIVQELGVALLVSPGATQASIGIALRPGPTAQVVRADGCVDDAFSGEVTVRIGAGPTAGALLGQATLKAEAGRATFTELAFTAAGTYDILFSTPGVGEAVVSGIHIGQATLGTITLSNTEAAILNAERIRYRPTVTLRTASGEFAPAGQVVRARVLSGQAVILAGDSAVVGANGAAVFSGIDVRYSGSFQLVFASQGFSSANLSGGNIVDGRAMLSSVGDTSVTIGQPFTVLSRVFAGNRSIGSVRFSVEWDPEVFELLQDSITTTHAQVATNHVRDGLLVTSVSFAEPLVPSALADIAALRFRVRPGMTGGHIFVSRTLDLRDANGAALNSVVASSTLSFQAR